MTLIKSEYATVPKLSYSCFYMDTILQYFLKDNDMTAAIIVHIEHPHITKYKNLIQLISLNVCIWVLCLCKCLCSCVEYNSVVWCLFCCELWALIWLLKTSVTTDLGCFVMLHSTDRQEKKKIQACHFCCFVFGILKLTQIVSLHPWLGNYIFR